ncbi:adenosylcobalamin-dependent ribonucleoside-diphosphate reductase [bacterium]|nr:adenosylcobalamin-dependent ribonucleoside-diphosphate reductase [bacterium]
MSNPANLLTPLGEKIFLDRYALKDGSKRSLKDGDTVVAVVDSKTGQREIGTVLKIAQGEVTVQLRDESRITCALEHVDKPVETRGEQMMDRVARGAADVERPELRERWEAEFRWLLDGWKFSPGGRIWTACGSDQQLTFYNCYVIPSPKDSRDGIFDTLSQMAEIMSRGGGVGINLSTLRPRYAYVKGVNGRSSGSVSWGGLYSFVTGLIEQGGSRRGALMLILNVWHPDVLEFIDAKREMGKITNANISIGITDDFMAAVEKDADWELAFPDTNDANYHNWTGNMSKWRERGGNVIVHKTVKAREIWNRIIGSAWASAEPGLWFVDRANKDSNSHYYDQGDLICTNPCGEQPLPQWSVCNLGHVNLSRFVEGGSVQWDQLARGVRTSVRFLDNVIDATPYFFPQNEKQQKAERRVGLGTVGLAEMLIRLGIRYGSPESLEFLDNLYKFIAREAYLASTDLAAEKGSFERFDAEPFLESGFMRGMPEDVRQAVREKGIRNVTLLTQAPTGTVGTMIGTSTGIEPFFFWSYFRKGRLGVHEEKVKVVQEWQDTHPGEPLPDYFVSAMDLSPEQHVRVQAAIQRWVDSAISKTCNCPSDFTVEQTRELYELMYRLGCKGGTIYRDQSRDEQVLNLKLEEAPAAVAPAPAPVSIEKHEPKVRPRPYKRYGVTVSKNTPAGTAHITMNDDAEGRPFEVFVDIGKGGSDIKAMAEALGRMASLVLRFNSPLSPKERVNEIINQLSGIGGPRSMGFGKNRVRSLPDALAQALEEQYLESADSGEIEIEEHPPQHEARPKSQVSADICPSCGNVSFQAIEGCQTCYSCGYSEC